MLFVFIVSAIFVPSSTIPADLLCHLLVGIYSARISSVLRYGLETMRWENAVVELEAMPPSTNPPARKSVEPHGNGHSKNRSTPNGDDAIRLVAPSSASVPFTPLVLPVSSASQKKILCP